MVKTTMLLLCIFFSPVHGLEEKPIAVVIPSYNNAQWCKRALDSIFSQRYQNYRVIYIDDASTDGTGDIVKKYAKERGQKHRVIVIKNAKRGGALSNVYKGIWLCEPHEIVANLDGDDWFYDEHVFEKLNKIYADPDVWVTYGQFIYWPCGSPGWAAQVPQYVIEQNAFREYSWVTTALRTFYAGIFQKIKKEDLLFNGDFFQMSGDLAYMWPVVEMAGRHSRFIPDVLYVYNIDTPINDEKKDAETQLNLGFVVRERQKYQPVEQPY